MSIQQIAKIVTIMVAGVNAVFFLTIFSYLLADAFKLKKSKRTP